MGMSNKHAAQTRTRQSPRTPNYKNSQLTGYILRSLAPMHGRRRPEERSKPRHETRSAAHRRENARAQRQARPRKAHHPRDRQREPDRGQPHAQRVAVIEQVRRWRAAAERPDLLEIRRRGPHGRAREGAGAALDLALLALRDGELVADEEERGEEGDDGREDVDDERACERGVRGLVDHRVRRGVVGRRGADELRFDCGEERGLCSGRGYGLGSSGERGEKGRTMTLMSCSLSIHDCTSPFMAFLRVFSSYSFWSSWVPSVGFSMSMPSKIIKGKSKGTVLAEATLDSLSNPKSLPQQEPPLSASSILWPLLRAPK